ncbi:hypothetical protein ACN42_g4566 [Penicillium freii]|uniref:Uncharacterized protein n=1 Tax=Penicillium freii TaxID=48697 RepID=A0A101ML52_PENFR|nr:hypothetical protein ACN42_g4566 [Penicillium freii]
MGGYASHTVHAATLIHPKLLTTTHELCVTSSHSIFLRLLLLLLPTTFSNAVPSRKHILAFVGGICCILHIDPIRKELHKLHILKAEIFYHTYFYYVSFAINI